MKIVVTARGAGMSAEVDPRFGRAAVFVLYDTDTREARTVDNGSSVDAAHGAGTRSAETISGLGAECVISGRCGPKAFRALTAAGMRIYTGASGTVADAVAAFSEGRLQVATSADV